MADELVLPDRVAPEARHRPELVERVRQRLRGLYAADAGPPRRRIHVSRAGARFRRLANESDLGAVLRNHGFEIVHFEALAFADQIRLAAEAQVICGPHGAGLANMMFTQAQCGILELRQLAGTPNCFFALAQALGHRYQVLACDRLQEGQHPHAADIVCAPASLDAALAAITAGT
jgi:capsular polysaccharide biosynthesis protein